MRQSSTSRSQPKINRPRQTTTKNSPFNESLDINQQYSHLLKQLAKVAFGEQKISDKGRLFSTV